MTSRTPDSTDWEWFLLISRSKPRVTQQFDSGRRKSRSERVPVSTDKQFTGPLVTSIAVGFTMLGPLVGLMVAYLWAWIAGR